MTIYVVTKGCYSDYSIVGLFSSYAYAKDYIINNTDNYSEFNDIEEWELDYRKGVHLKNAWHFSVREETNTITEDPMSRTECKPGMRSKITPTVWGARCISFVSREHGHKLAVEWLQEYRASQEIFDL